MGALELYPLDQVSSNCELKVHQIEAFYFKMFKTIFPGGHTPGPPCVTSTPQSKHVHTFEAMLTYISYVNTFLFL